MIKNFNSIWRDIFRFPSINTDRNLTLISPTSYSKETKHIRSQSMNSEQTMNFERQLNASAMADEDRAAVRDLISAIRSDEDRADLRDLISALAKRGCYTSDTWLSDEEISAFLTIRSFEDDDKKEDVKTCAICLDLYRKNQKVGVLDCGHEYHPSCIKKWLHKKNICPVCQRIAAG